MLGFEHLLALIAFILIGGLGMASMQDGGTLIWRHLKGRLPRVPRRSSYPLAGTAEPLTFRR